MPPQQADGLLDFIDDRLDFGAHDGACVDGRGRAVNPSVTAGGGDAAIRDGAYLCRMRLRKRRTHLHEDNVANALVAPTSKESAMSKDFTGKVAIVTGAASGIGEACAKELAERGAKVVVADFNVDGARSVADAIGKAGGTAAAFKIDVANAAEVEAMVKFAVATYGALHLAVNNAGIGGPAAPIADYPLDGWQHIIGVNLSSVFYGLKYEIPAIMAAGGGAIVNMASILGTVGIANAVGYVAAKHAILGITRNAALEYGSKGVRVNAVGPAFIETPLLANLDDAFRQGLIALHPIGRLGKSEEVAALVLFLLSEKASFITGSYHLVDGGYTSQ
jgi:NAD(P)-dependent dehydrogenase (short-subunit alcohol dehydrogenase family)